MLKQWTVEIAETGTPVRCDTGKPADVQDYWCSMVAIASEDNTKAVFVAPLSDVATDKSNANSILPGLIDNFPPLNVNGYQSKEIYVNGDAGDKIFMRCKQL